MNREICYQVCRSIGPGFVGEHDTRMVLAEGIVVASVAAAPGGLGVRPGLAHNDWGPPRVGGLVGGYALSGMMHQRQRRSREETIAEPV